MYGIPNIGALLHDSDELYIKSEDAFAIVRHVLVEHAEPSIAYLKSELGLSQKYRFDHLLEHILEDNHIACFAMGLGPDTTPELTPYHARQALRTIAILWFLVVTQRLTSDDISQLMRTFRRRWSFPNQHLLVKREMHLMGRVISLKLFQAWQKKFASTLKNPDELQVWEFACLSASCPQRKVLAKQLEVLDKQFDDDFPSRNDDDERAHAAASESQFVPVTELLPITDSRTGKKPLKEEKRPIKKPSLRRPASTGSLKLYAIPKRMPKDLDPSSIPLQREEAFVDACLRAESKKQKAFRRSRTGTPDSKSRLNREDRDAQILKHLSALEPPFVSKPKKTTRSPKKRKTVKNLSRSFSFPSDSLQRDGHVRTTTKVGNPPVQRDQNELRADSKNRQSTPMTTSSSANAPEQSAEKHESRPHQRFDELLQSTIDRALEHEREARVKHKFQSSIFDKKLLSNKYREYRHDDEQSLDNDRNRMRRRYSNNYKFLSSTMAAPGNPFLSSTSTTEPRTHAQAKAQLAPMFTTADSFFTLLRKEKTRRANWNLTKSPSDSILKDPANSGNMRKKDNQNRVHFLRSDR